MKAIRGIGTIIVLAVLIAAIVLTLAVGLVRFVAMNPAFLKTFLPTDGYCEELRARITEDLDHVALLYGIEEGKLGGLIRNSTIRVYTGEMIDAFFAAEDAADLKLPNYPTETFEAFAREQTGFDAQGVSDFSEDCAKAVEEDLAAIDIPEIVGSFTELRNHQLMKWSLPLFVAGALLTIVMIAFLKLMYAGGSGRFGSVVVMGGLFMGVTIVFVPVMQFLLFDYVGRLKLTASAFRTVLTGYLNTVLYGCFFVLLTLEILMILFSIIAVIRASKRR